MLALFAGAGAYTAFVAWVEARYERLILLDLAVLETRFERITDLRAARLQRPAARQRPIRAAWPLIFP